MGFTMHLLLSITILVASVAASPLAAPLNINPESTHVNKRNDWDDWPRCTTRPEGECTLYIATGKPEFAPDPDQVYRNFALFDNECKLTSFQENMASVGWILMQGHLEEPVAIAIDQGVEPEGMIYHAEKSCSIEDRMECRDWDELDGVGCRAHFTCTEAY